jgi:hypothetical protein
MIPETQRRLQVGAAAGGQTQPPKRAFLKQNMNRIWKLLDLPEKPCFPVIAPVLGYPTQMLDVIKRLGYLET